MGHPVQHPYVYFLFLSESFKAHDDQLIALEKKNKELKNKVEETTLMAEINGLKELVNGKFYMHIFCHRLVLGTGVYFSSLSEPSEKIFEPS